jgi:hypothetical protein
VVVREGGWSGDKAERDVEIRDEERDVTGERCTSDAREGGE